MTEDSQLEMLNKGKVHTRSHYPSSYPEEGGGGFNGLVHIGLKTNQNYDLAYASLSSWGF